MSTIQCGENCLRIPSNAYEALVHLRKNSGKRTLWIDAICINQYDLAERNQQI
ncbi:uncharacterized protein M421DRAFT_415623 [Didymella exigua CBS 183.55]|uniref:Heterokaryon incompatibility domain-containing protein n=1 Tax=Didymella exigua CBS 183.55 TaxID=1150837 RepID=A0A6A5S0H4_9PLEO|nr:uncharacterized protein M421DRAFT_415623 [Didymella exigua CBS 183.55]KAF1933279.1 hypothetical protein M421DRAFT_415623 [Didymella exigua CBS 183.55]